MDPDMALRLACEALRAFRNADDKLENPDLSIPAQARLMRLRNEAAAKLAEHFEALDGWLTNGGFLPKLWERA